MLTTIVLCGTDSAQLCLNYCLSNAAERGHDYARVAGSSMQILRSTERVGQGRCSQRCSGATLFLRRIFILNLSIAGNYVTYFTYA